MSKSKVDSTVSRFYKSEGKSIFQRIDDEIIRTRNVYEQYEDYCERNALEKVTIFKFTMDIKKLVPNLKTKSKSLSYYYLDDE